MMWMEVIENDMKLLELEERMVVWPGFCFVVSTYIIVLLILLARPMGFCFPFSFFGRVINKKQLGGLKN